MISVSVLVRKDDGCRQGNKYIFRICEEGDLGFTVKIFSFLAESGRTGGCSPACLIGKNGQLKPLVVVKRLASALNLI